MIGANFSAYGSTNGMTQTDDHARHQAVARSSCRSSAATTPAVAAGAFAPRRSPPAIGDVARHHRRHAAAEHAVVTYPTPTVTDNEDPSPDVSCTPASGTRVHASARRASPARPRDANGNTATKTFTVTVRGLRPVGGTVPATLSLTLGAPATFGAFTPGVDAEYTASTTANVIRRPATRR